MNLRYTLLLTIASLILSPVELLAQGCSDAGFCTMGAMKPDQDYNRRKDLKLRSVEINYYQGKSTLSPVISAVTMDFNIALDKRNALQVKVPYMWVTGNFGENSGVGDISLTYTRNLKNYKNWALNGSLGAKIPSGGSTATQNNEFTNNQDAHFPMYYQVSLGTYDAIAGASLISENWLFATGVQVALTHNDNRFVHSEWTGYPSDEYRVQNNVGQRLKRGVDVMLRVERNFRFTHYNFSVGLLPIYRLTPDQGIPEGETEIQDIPNTTGLALSALFGAGYQFDVNHSVKLIRGIKLEDRKFNPDGLTRNSVWSLSYIYQF